MVFIQSCASVPEFIELTKDVSTGVHLQPSGGVLETPKSPRAMELMATFERSTAFPSGPYGIALYEQ
jgi:branched-chain amino acid transport system substrate-binding protein